MSLDRSPTIFPILHQRISPIPFLRNTNGLQPPKTAGTVMNFTDIVRKRATQLIEDGTVACVIGLDRQAISSISVLRFAQMTPNKLHSLSAMRRHCRARIGEICARTERQGAGWPYHPRMRKPAQSTVSSPTTNSSVKTCISLASLAPGCATRDRARAQALLRVPVPQSSCLR